MTRDPLLSVLPEDALRDVLEVEDENRRRRRSRRPYPTRRDIAEAVAEAARIFYGHPDEFPDLVYKLLEERGFYTGLVTVKRIWGIYEELVKKNVIADYLGVMGER